MFLTEPSKIMQKLLGRIRQQQDEWSKQNADRRMDKLMEDEQIRRGRALQRITALPFGLFGGQIQKSGLIESF